MISTNLLNNEVENLNNVEASESSSDTGSDISLSEKIILESNEKRLRQKMTSLQNSITNLKEQLRLEKELWKEDIEKIRSLQQLQQQQELKCTHSCTCQKSEIRFENASRSSSNYTLGGAESVISRKNDDILKNCSIKQILEFQNYKRKLAETENMCNLELTRVKQSLEDLKTLQKITSEWGRNGNNENDAQIQEIFVKSE